MLLKAKVQFEDLQAQMHQMLVGMRQQEKVVEELIESRIQTLELLLAHPSPSRSMCQ